MLREFVNNFSFSTRIFLMFMFFLSITYLGAFLSTFYIKQKIDKDHRKWADSYMGPLSWGLLFLIAFTISNTWNFQSSALYTINQEATNLRLIYLYADTFPNSIKKGVLSAEKDYINSLAGEWDTLKKGYESDASREKIHNFYKYFSSIQLKNENQKLFYMQIFRYMDQVMMLRRDRIQKAHGLMPRQLLYLIFILTIVLCFSLGSIRGETKFTGIWPLIVFTFSISLFLSLILDFNYPFSGEIVPSLKIYGQVFENFQKVNYENF